MSGPAPAEHAASASAVVASIPGTAAATAGAAQPCANSTTFCANCGAALAGKYCSECGQRHHEQPVHHFWHFVREATEDLTHADSRLWQTLIALLFRPGFLTREFLEGRRARYLPPVRLYLVVSLIFFVIAGLQSQTKSPRVIVLSRSGKSFHYQVVPLPQPAGAIGRTPRPAVGAGPAAVAQLAQTPAGMQALCEQSGTRIQQQGGWLGALGPRVTRNCEAAIAEGGLERLNQAVEHNLERAMFLLLPLLALVMKPLYLKPARHYVEHLLFFLHDHACVFVLLGAGTLLQMITSAGVVTRAVDTAITIYILVYYYRAMRHVYGQGPWLTLSKMGVLAVAYLFLGVLMLGATVSYTFLML